MAAKRGKFKVLEKLWEWAKELQLKPEELRNEVLLSKDNLNNTAWHMSAKWDEFNVLENLRELVKEEQQELMERVISVREI